MVVVQHAWSSPSVTEIEDGLQLIGKIPGVVAKEALETEGMTQWPPKKQIQELRAKTDISESLNPKVPWVGKPDFFPAVSPESAIYEARDWVVMVLQKRWVAPDILERLLPLRNTRAERSVVISRYQVGGDKIQIIQRRALMWIVIRPKELPQPASSPREIGAHVFKRFFIDGDRMATIIPKRVEGGPRGVSVFIPDTSEPMSWEAKEECWGWRLWYTEGSAVAVLLEKRSASSASNPTVRDLWF